VSLIAEPFDIDYVKKEFCTAVQSKPEDIITIAKLYKTVVVHWQQRAIVDEHIEEVRAYLRCVERMPHSKCSEVDALIIKRQPDIINLLKKKYPEEFV